MKLTDLQSKADLLPTYVELLDFLQSQGLGLNFILQDDSTVLHLLCSRKDLSLETLIETIENTSIDIDRTDEQGISAFSLLLNNFSIPYLTRLKAAEIFLEYGADPDAKSSRYPSPRVLLHFSDTKAPWDIPLLSGLTTRIKTIEIDSEGTHHYEHEYQSTYDSQIVYHSFKDFISERDFYSLQNLIDNNRELYNKLDKGYIDIILKSRWGNLFKPDDSEILRLLFVNNFHVDENNLFEYIILQKTFLSNILKMLREVKPCLARTMSIWLLVSKELSGSEKLAVIKDIVDSSGGLDITEEIKSSVVYLEEDSIDALIDVVFSSKAHVRWNEVMDEYVIATSEMLGVQIDELLSNSTNIIYNSESSATKEEVKDALDNIRDKFTFRR